MSSPPVSPSVPICASSSSRPAKGLSCPQHVSLLTLYSGKALFESRTPSAFVRLFGGPHDYNLYTVPQQYAANKKKFWPRGM